MRTATGFDIALLVFLMGLATAGIVAMTWLVFSGGWSP